MELLLYLKVDFFSLTQIQSLHCRLDFLRTNPKQRHHNN